MPKDAGQWGRSTAGHIGVELFKQPVGNMADEYTGGSRLGPWAEQASCAGIDSEMFYPELLSPANAALAIRVCQSCPVRQECLHHAIENNEQYGIWGGTTVMERQKIWRQRRFQERVKRLQP